MKRLLFITFAGTFALSACAWLPFMGTVPTAMSPVQAESSLGDSEFRDQQAKGLSGDKDAALRVAQMFQHGTNGLVRDEQKMVQWLRHASDLENGSASYQLYLYYLGRGLDRNAVYYETRALQQGYMPPPRLDPRRG
jgi:TPR repeat protein